MTVLPLSLLDALPDPVLLVESGRRVSLANRAARAWLGEGVAGRDLALALRDPEALAAVEAVLGGAPERSATLRQSVPVEREIDLRVVALGDGSGQVMVASRDVTGIRHAERIRADFVANVSHELRSPLAALISIVETLRNAAADDAPAREHFLGIMQREADRMRRLIDDLLSLSRIETNEHVPPSETVDLARLVHQVVELLAGRARERRMNVEIDLAASSTEVMGDADQLTQVLQNLIDNAIKYGREGTAVKVILRPSESGRGLVLSVTDQGEGIPREDLPRLTERFYRVDKGRSRNLGGTGLGLAIVKHIVNRHQGRLNIQSQPGVGTTVGVTLSAVIKP